jgi:hypothetical protein
MKFTALLLRLVVVLAAFALAAGTAQADPKSYRLSGNARAQIGGGLPIPITLGAPPNGAILATTFARVLQTQGADPKQMTLPKSQLTHPGGDRNQPTLLFNSALFQVRTNLNVRVAGATPAVFKAGGRTGASVVSWCAGQTVPPGGNPGCASPGAGPGILGRAKYVATSNQFGGPVKSILKGQVTPTYSRGATGVLKGFGVPPCSNCMGIFFFATPGPQVAAGNVFNFKQTTPARVPPFPSGYAFVGVTVGGLVTNVLGPAGKPGLTNKATSYGAPFTTGKIYVTNSSGPTGTPVEKFTLSGADNRVNGIGTISLVAGGVSARTLSKGNANRGWLNLTIEEWRPGPTMALPGLAALVGLVALAGGYALRRQNRS